MFFFITYFIKEVEGSLHLFTVDQHVLVDGSHAELRERDSQFFTVVWVTVAVQLEEYRIEPFFDASHLFFALSIFYAIEMVGFKSFFQSEDAITFFVQSLKNLCYHKFLLVRKHLLSEKVVNGYLSYRFGFEIQEVSKCLFNKTFVGKWQ